MIFNEKTPINAFELEHFKGSKYIYAIDPTPQEQAYFNELLDLPEHIISDGLKMNEGRRIIKLPSGLVVVYIFVPIQTGKYDYKLSPVVIISSKDEKVVIAKEGLDFLEDMMGDNLGEHISGETISRITDKYLDVLGEIANSIQELVQRIKANTQQSDMVDVFSLQMSIISIDLAIDALRVVLEDGLEKRIFNARAEIAEAKLQLSHASRTVDTYISILQSAIDMIEGVINNRLNDIMKFLTGLTLVLSIPMVVAGFWGMNVPVPLAKSASGFLGIILVTTLVTILATWVLVKKKFM